MSWEHPPRAGRKLEEVSGLTVLLLLLLQEKLMHKLVGLLPPSASTSRCY